MTDIHVLEADHYREEELELMLDPIIQKMAAEIPNDGTVDLNDWNFTKNAMDEYHSRGGTRSRSIGGAARAIRALKEKSNG